MRTRYGAKMERSLWMRTHAQTAGCSLTVEQPENNVVRVALQAMAAVLGGTQSLHTNSLDEAYALPSESAVITALRTQQIIAHESGVTNTVDPLGGSYFLESLTNELERQAYDYFKRIEDMGGVVAGIENGFFHREIADASFRYQQEFERKQRVIVGLNEYVSGEAEPIPLLAMDKEGYRRQVERLARVRSQRDGRKTQAALADLRRAAGSTENLMPYLLEAARSYATLGETMDVLKGVWGEYQPFGAPYKKAQ